MAVPGLIIAWLIKRSSPGPVFYHQERMGLDGKQFVVYKFRTMPLDAEDDRARCGPTRTTRGRRRSAAGCAGTTSTSGRSSGTC